jgi:UDP-arabinose 4-epimerase
MGRCERYGGGKNFMTSKILVTGGAGYIGSHTCKALAAAGYTPVALDNLSAGHRWAVKWGPLVVADIADRARVSQAIEEYGVQAAIYFAAHAYVGESILQPRKYFDNNVTKSLALLDTLLEAGITKLVFSSFCATYGAPQELPIAEDHQQQPINPYGASILFVEKILHWYEGAYDMRHMILRYFNAGGADPEGEIGEEHTPETHIVPLVIAAALGVNPAVEIFGTDYDTADRTAVRDYVHVCDLATAHIKALDRLLAGGERQRQSGHRSRTLDSRCHLGRRGGEPQGRSGHRSSPPVWRPACADHRSPTRTIPAGMETAEIGSAYDRADGMGVAPDSTP